MTAPSENLTWPPAREDVEALLQAVGSDPVQVTGGGTSLVFRVRERTGESLIVRIAPPDADDDALRTHVRAARGLVAAGVPFANPRTTALLSHRPLTATLWDDLGPSSAPDYEAFGHTVAALHRVSDSDFLSIPAEDDPDFAREALISLPDADDRDAIWVAYEDAVSTGALTLEEAAHLQPRLAAMDAFYSTLDDADGCLVHDDLWPKNVVFTDRGAYLLDPDNLAWGRPEYDLAFITRALTSHLITSDQADAFASGYGANLPDAERAEFLALPHRLRWILACARRRAWSQNAATAFDMEFFKPSPVWI